MKLSTVQILDLKDAIIKSVICYLYSQILSVSDLEKIIEEYKADTE